LLDNDVIGTAFWYVIILSFIAGKFIFEVLYIVQACQMAGHNPNIEQGVQITPQCTDAWKISKSIFPWTYIQEKMLYGNQHHIQPKQQAPNSHANYGMPLHLQTWIDGAYTSCTPNHQSQKHCQIARH